MISSPSDAILLAPALLTCCSNEEYHDLEVPSYTSASPAHQLHNFDGTYAMMSMYSGRVRGLRNWIGNANNCAKTAATNIRFLESFISFKTTMVVVRHKIATMTMIALARAEVVLAATSFCSGSIPSNLLPTIGSLGRMLRNGLVINSRKGSSSQSMMMFSTESSGSSRSSHTAARALPSSHTARSIPR
jgi:hypothetical protein